MPDIAAVFVFTFLLSFGDNTDSIESWLLIERKSGILLNLW